jgi:hypothetical protein
MTVSEFQKERAKFHAKITKRLLVIAEGNASNADTANQTSCVIANAIGQQLSASTGKRLAAQTAGDEFEAAVAEFLSVAFRKLIHLRPGEWKIGTIGSRSGSALNAYEQYQHLASIGTIMNQHRELAVALGNDYQISPDILMSRSQESDQKINKHLALVDSTVSKAASLRQKAEPIELLHASISCKWTLRSDRAQNARSEALNLIRNRKGRAPHIVVVTGEPLPSRLSSLALGTGDIDCVYHFALYELESAVKLVRQSEASDLLRMMVEGGRLKDISDLPIDLAI